LHPVKKIKYKKNLPMPSLHHRRSAQQLMPGLPSTASIGHSIFSISPSKTRADRAPTWYMWICWEKIW
jgi:hypothetical protein